MAGLYAHIPFCHSKCAYCDFYSMPPKRHEDIERLCRALAKELEMRGAGMEFKTAYLGGGTPSILPIELLEQLLRSFPKGLDEFTIEANPEDVSVEKAAKWREMGIGRVSMGVQSLADDELKLIGRRHSAEQALRAFDQLRLAGFDNISLDLIYGLPGQSLESWRQSLAMLLDLKPEHFSAYMLSYEPRTKLASMLQAGKITETPEETLIDMYAALIEETRRRGYEHYEISNFALPGFRAKHNSAYWSGIPYLGLGPGAHSYDGVDRYYNPSSLKDYLASIESGRLACQKDEEDDCNRFNDKVMTALRTSAGLDLSTIPEQRMRLLMADSQAYLKSGDLILSNGRLCIPETSWLISDAIISDLFQV